MATCRLTTVFAMVSDMAEAARFVQAATGTAPITASEAWTEFDTGPAHLALHRSRSAGATAIAAGAPGSVHLSLATQDLGGALARLRDGGWAPSEPEHLEGMTALSSRVAGPDGIHLHLVET